MLKEYRNAEEFNEKFKEALKSLKEEADVLGSKISKVEKYLDHVHYLNTRDVPKVVPEGMKNGEIVFPVYAFSNLYNKINHSTELKSIEDKYSNYLDYYYLSEDTIPNGLVFEKNDTLRMVLRKLADLLSDLKEPNN